MKTSLKALTLFSAACIPGAFAVELAGVSLPAGLDPLGAFSAFVASVVTLVVFTDYRRPRRRLMESAMMHRAHLAKATHPLAA